MQNWLVVFVAAAGFGGFCAFGFQALDHELSHAKATPLSTSLGLAGSAFTLVPWFSYYFSGGCVFCEWRVAAGARMEVC